jgi:hypothetical protein
MPMTNGRHPASPEEGPPDASGPSSSVVPDPVPLSGRIILGIYFAGLATLTFYLLVASWPVAASNNDAAAAGNATGFAAFYLFGLGPFSPPSDLRLFFTVIAAGALGAMIHTLTSFADYVGNRTLSMSWIWWFILRPPIGIALAMLFYVVLRAGMIVPSLPSASSRADMSSLLNPYGIAGISALAGMFSKQATDKLREVFDTLFLTREPVRRADPLRRAVPVISRTDPAKLSVGGPPKLEVFGRGFARDCTVTIGGEDRGVRWIGDAQISVTLVEDDVAKKGELSLVVRNPAPAGGDSLVFRVPVE